MNRSSVQKFSEQASAAHWNNRFISVVNTLKEFIQSVGEVIIRLLISACLFILPPLVLTIMISEKEEVAWYFMLSIHGWLFMGVVGFVYLLVRWVFELRRPTMDTIEVIARLLGLERGVRVKEDCPALFRTQGGDKYHVRGCPCLKKSKIAVLWDEIENEKLEACGFCRPPEPPKQADVSC